MVDLITKSTRLEDAMLAEYPGIIIPAKQYEKDTSIPGVNYLKFKDLDEEELMKFLSGYKECDYVVLDEGKLVLSNGSKETNIDWSEVLQEMTVNNLTSYN